jgi:transposase InsO family protein
MNIHSRARTCPASRALLVQRVEEAAWSADQAACAAGISRRTVFKWLRRYREEGRGGLQDRSSRPRRMPRITPAEWRQMAIQLRGLRLTAMQIAQRLRLPRSTVARILTRNRLGRIKYLQPPEPVCRYERQLPGELVHVDVKKLGRIHGAGHRITGQRAVRARGVGWEYVHVCIDDCSRLAYVEVLDAESGDLAVAFLHRALAFYRQHGVRVRAVMTDNAKAYLGHLFRATCQRYRLRHLTTRPYRPCTNGKAERFIQTLLREWAYIRSYTSSRQRREVLPRWLWSYNHQRRHGSLNDRPPISRIHFVGEQRA